LIELKLNKQPQPIVIRSLIEGLRDGEDEVNSFLIGMLRKRDAANWVPVKFRARDLTIQRTLQLAAAGATRSRQVVGAVEQIPKICDAPSSSVTPAWIGMLATRPFFVRTEQTRVDMADAIHGFSILGLCRFGGGTELADVFKGIRQRHVKASPALLAQCLLHLSGRDLRAALVDWLRGPDRARDAAILAVRFLQIEPVGLGTKPDAKDAAAALAWAKALPPGATWHRLAADQLTQLAKLKAKGLEKSDAARLALARRYIGLLPSADIGNWYRTAAPEARTEGMQSLIGFDILVAGFHPQPGR
jgi:hypothetical protein